MGEITQFNRNETEKIDVSSFKKRVFEHKMRRFAIAAIGVAAIIVVAIVIMVSNNNRVYTSYEVIDEVECVSVEGANVLSYQDQFVTYSVDGIHCTNAKGVDVWSEPFEMQKPIIEISGEYIVAADYNGRDVYIYNGKGRIGDIKTSSPIKNVTISSTGVIAVTTDEGQVTPISLYYYDGTAIATFRTTMSKSGYPVDVGISDDGKLVAVSYLYMDKGLLTSRVAFYNFGEVGQNETDNLVSGYDYEKEVIPVVEFLGNSNAFAVANDKLLFYSGKERPTNTANIIINEEIQAVYYGENNVGLLYFDKTGEHRYRFEVYSTDGKLKTQLWFDIECSDIFFANDMIVIYNSNTAMIYNINGKLRFSGEFEEGVKLLIPTKSATKYNIVTPEAIQTILLN